MAFFWQKKRNPTLLTEELQAVCSQHGSDFMEFHVRLSGRVTIDSSPGLREFLLDRLDDPACQTLGADFSGVSYVDTSGLAVLVESLRAARMQGKAFRLYELQGRPRFLLEKTHLLRLFDESNPVPTPKSEGRL